MKDETPKYGEFIKQQTTTGGQIDCLVIKPKDITWLESDGYYIHLKGYVGKLYLFTIDADPLERDKKNPFLLQTSLPNVMPEMVDSILMGKIRAYKMLEYWISLLAL